jgi:DNA-binding NtrC family response regulator
MARKKAGKTIRVICVEKEDDFSYRLRRLFPARNIQILREPTVDRVLERFESDTYDVLLLTGSAVRTGAMDAIDLLQVISAKSPLTQILLLISPGEIRLAMSALKAGTYQYAKLPISDEELRLLVETSLSNRPAVDENLFLKGDKTEKKFGKLIGQSDSMQGVYRQIRQAASTDIAVLLTGETGTGKDLAAQAIHNQSERASGTYLPVHLGALPQELVASELFGHEKGAFTGATSRHIGAIETADGGTVFLDEISTIDEKVQVSLLRLLEQKRFHRIGGRKAITSDIRLIAASNENLRDAVQKGAFREDLYFRLDVFNISLPPLRDRGDDITPLIDEFIKTSGREFNKKVVGISPECLSRLQDYNWPGNVRELKNVVLRAVLVCSGEVLLPDHLPPRFRSKRRGSEAITFKIGTTLAEAEKEMIRRTLSAADNNRTRTAELLGISRRALYNKLKKHGIH